MTRKFVKRSIFFKLANEITKGYKYCFKDKKRKENIIWMLITKHYAWCYVIPAHTRLSFQADIHTNKLV